MSIFVEESKKLETNLSEDINIESYLELSQPNMLKQTLPVSDEIQQFIKESREQVSQIISGEDKRKLFIVGPCSIHNLEQAKVYGQELKKIADMIKNKVFVVMRVYFEKPRTTVGWKGFINDPDLNGSFNVNKGLYQARELLLYLNSIGLPCGYEVLDTITPQYICDLISWGAVGARTTESQVHRQLVSGLSMPVGFKNGTNGNIKIAADAIISSSSSHCFMGITNTGQAAICKTKGNTSCHLILRGGSSGPNYESNHIEETETILKSNNLIPKIMVDCSHGNSKKDYRNQHIVLNDVLLQIQAGNESIIGCMIESNLHEGKQKISDDLKYGISITDSCISIGETERILLNFSNKV